MLNSKRENMSEFVEILKKNRGIKGREKWKII